MKKLIVLLFVFLSMPVDAKAPKVLLNALNAYMEKGKEVFIPTMLKGSVLEGEKSVLTQVNMLSQVEAYYGKAESWEILSICDITDRIRKTYYIMYFENGPVYGSLDSFIKKDDNEVTMSFLFHTEAVRIFPHSTVNTNKLCKG